MTIKERESVEHNICFDKNDLYIKEKTVWVCELTNGKTAYCDDWRGDPPIAWKRLKLYCDAGGYKINSLYLKFRSHKVPIDIGGYDRVGIVNSVVFVYPDMQRDSFNVVCEKNQQCDVTQYITPEVEIFRKFYRSSDSYEQILIDINNNG